MKTILHRYDTSKRFLEVMAKSMGGKTEGNYVKVNNEIYKGTHFTLAIEDGVSAMLFDAQYKEDVLLKYQNKDRRSIGLYFYLTNSDINFIVNKKNASIGKLNYNLSVVDCALSMEYKVQKATKVFIICIWFNKDTLKKYFFKESRFIPVVNNFLNSKTNTKFHLDRMNIESLILINDFKKISYNSPLYEIYFKSLVYGLLGNYLKQLKTRTAVIAKDLTIDERKIIASKAMLLSFIEESFPGIDFLAKQVAMSTSKYKRLFVEISGVNPGTFFYENKLNKAKELLETGKFTINEVSQKLNYANVSYLSKRFSNRYGVPPKEYKTLL